MSFFGIFKAALGFFILVQAILLLPRPFIIPWFDYLYSVLAIRH